MVAMANSMIELDQQYTRSGPSPVPPSGVTLSGQVNTQQLQENIQKFLSQKYRPPKARLIREKKAHAALRFTIDKMRGEVVPNPSRWERLELWAIIPASMGSEPAIHLLLDGYIASGNSMEPPPYDRYTTNMNRNHATEIQQYVDALGSDLKNFLESQP